MDQWGCWQNANGSAGWTYGYATPNALGGHTKNGTEVKPF